MEIMKIEKKGKHLNTLEKYHIYWVFRAQADWTFILPSELPAKELCHLL
jgi:hypothetical protein